MIKALNKIKNSKTKIIILSVFVLVLFIPVFTIYNIINPTSINKKMTSIFYKAPANNSFIDQVFYNAVIDAYNRENNTSLPYTTDLTDEQLATITAVTYSGYNKTDKITYVNGVGKLTNLKTLQLAYNNITQIDLSSNTKLEKLTLTENKIDSINITNCIELEEAYLGTNRLTQINVSQNPALTRLNLGTNSLDQIDISNNQNLETLQLFRNNLTSINVSQNPALKTLNLDENNISQIDISNNLTLRWLGLSHNNLSTINVSGNTELTSLYVGSNNLSEINVRNNTKLTELDLGDNNLSTIDVSQNTLLTSLAVVMNNLSTIDVSQNTLLEELRVDTNNLTGIDLSQNTLLTILSLTKNSITEIDLSKNTALTDLFLTQNNLSTIDVSKNTLLRYLYLENNNLSEIDVTKNTSLIYLKLSNNPFSLGDYYMLISETMTGVDSIKLLSKYPLIYDVSNSRVASYNNDTKEIRALQIGETNVTASNSTTGLNAIGTIRVFDIESYRYRIDKTKDYIYTGIDDDETILSNINILGEGATKEISNDNFVIKYGDEVVRQFKLVRISSNTYNLEKSYIYIGTGSFDLSKITCANGSMEVYNNKLYIKYGDSILDSREICSISFGGLTVRDKEIIVSNNTYEDVRSNVTPVGVGYRILDGDTEIISGKINDGMILNVFYSSDILDTYTFKEQVIPVEDVKTISLECPTSVVAGEEFTCMLKGSSETGGVKDVDLKVEMPEGFTLKTLTIADGWEGSGEDGHIDIHSDTAKTEVYNIATIIVVASSSIEDNTEKEIDVIDIELLDENDATKTLDDQKALITVKATESDEPENIPADETKPKPTP